MHAPGLTLLAALAACAAALAGYPPPPKDWSAHMGALAFAVGHAKGLEEVKFTGRPPMYFFTSSTDKWCPAFAARTWNDAETLAAVAGYSPVLIDADVEKDLVEKLSVALVPSVVWADFDDDVVFIAMGDSPIDLLRIAAATGKDRCPDAHPASEGYAALQQQAGRLRTALAANDTKSAVSLVLAIRKVGLGADVQAEARRADARLSAEGEALLEKAKQHVAAKRKAEARKVLEQVVADFPADHPVGRRASEALAEVDGKRKPAPRPPGK